MSASAPRPAPSLRRSLLLGLLLPLALLVPLSATLIYRLVLTPAMDALDRDLTDTALALAQILVVEDGAAQLPLSEQTARALRADPIDEVQFAVSDAQGRLLAGSAALQGLSPPLQAGEWRFFGGTLEGTALRLAAHGKACGAAPEQVCRIVVSETLGKRRAAERAALLAALLGALAIALPLLGFSLLAVRRALRPLDRAVQQVEQLGPDRLAPVSAEAMPAEVRGFVNAMNRLLARLDSAAALQRAFVSNAAHQLRTPMSVMRIEAARALATAHGEDLHPGLERLHAAAERGSRLAQQLLTLARADGTALGAEAPRQPLDLARLATASADRWLRPSLEAGQDLGFELKPAWILGDALLIEELIGNLVHNAIEHAGPGARVTIRTWQDGAEAVLTVEDDGRGIEADEREQLWERFRRGRRAQGSGSGLGLAIVADIARLHGARASLGPGEQGRGLRVRLDFPSVAPPG